MRDPRRGEGGRTLEPLMTTDELATFLRVPVRTLEAWRQARPPKGPPFLRVGGQIRYRPEAVQEWLNRQETTPEA
jgi:excisionase family DNA binding protein